MADQTPPSGQLIINGIQPLPNLQISTLLNSFCSLVILLCLRIRCPQGSMFSRDFFLALAFACHGIKAYLDPVMCDRCPSTVNK